MKRLLIITWVSLAFITTIQAQCIPDSIVAQEGFTPASENIACITPNRLTDITLQFLCFDSVDYMGSKFKLNEIEFTAINNLPCGIKWTTSNQGAQPPHRFYSGELGCFRFTGVTTDSAGLYELEALAEITLQGIPLPIPVSLKNDLGISIAFRVKSDAGATCPPLAAWDTVVASCASVDTFLQTPTNAIHGLVFLDQNQNGQRDSTEPGLAGQKISIFGGTSSVITNNIGTYKIGPTPTQLTLLPDTNLYTPTTNTSLTTTQGVFTNYNFGLYPKGNYTDLRVSVVPGTAIEGETCRQYINFQNIGNQPELSGTVIYVPDSRYNFFMSNPAPDAQQGDTLLWYYSNLNASETRQIELELLVPDNLSLLGDSLTGTAHIIPSANDVNIDDNTWSSINVVVESSQSTYKSVTPAGKIPLSFVEDRENLTYIIYFQNRVHDTTFTLTIRDLINISMLDMNTFNMLGASDEYYLTLINNYIGEWTLEDLLLPDSSTNESESHGYIMFQIKPLETVSGGDTIKNSAVLHFDHHPLVLTNTVETIVDFGIGINNIHLPQLPIILYPNPAYNTLTVNVGQELNGSSISLTDLSGRVVLSQQQVSSSSTILDVSSLSKGLYFVRVQQPGYASFTGKVMILR